MILDDKFNQNLYYKDDIYQPYKMKNVNKNVFNR